MRPDDVYQPDLSQLDIKSDEHRPAVTQTSDPPPLIFDGTPFAPQAPQMNDAPAAAYSGGAIDLSASRGPEIDLSVPHQGAALERQQRELAEQENSFTGQATAVLRESGIHEYLPAQVQEVLGPAPQQPAPGPEYYSEEAQRQRAAERACEGRWVPTYMRQQLIQNGHTELPTRANPNAHEYRSGETPPSLLEALKGMGEDIGNLLYAALGGIFDLTAQCKRAAHQVTEKAHHIGDGVSIEHCDEVCFGVCGSPPVNTEDTDPEAIPPVLPETTPTLGPIRSRLRRELPCTFEALALIAKMRLLTPHAPPELQRLVKRREFHRQVSDHKSASERWHLFLEPGADASPSIEDFSQLHPHASPSQLREIWQVYPKYCRASVEISNEPSWGAKVLVCLKMDIVQLPDGMNCEIDSRLYMLPRDRDPDRQEIDLPTSLIEALIDAHHVQTERVRDLVLAIVAADDSKTVGVAPGKLSPGASDVRSTAVKVSMNEPPPMNLPGQPSYPSQDSPLPSPHQAAPSKPKASQPVGDNAFSRDKSGPGSGIDKDLMLKFADGI